MFSVSAGMPVSTTFITDLLYLDWQERTLKDGSYREVTVHH